MSLWEAVVQIISAFLGVLAVAIVFQVPKNRLVLTGLTGAGGWMVYLIGMRVSENAVFASFLAAFAVAIMSQIFARISKAPVTIYLVTGILPLVPGVGMYRTVYYLLQNDTAQTSYYLSYTLQVAGMIALGIFVVDSFFRIFLKRCGKRKQRRVVR